MDRILTAKIVNECGYQEALTGLSFNKDKDPSKMERVAERLANMDGGHNKFLESIYIWIEVRASRFFWQEADTYRVGSTKQSQSTMHTIKNKVLSQKDFCEDIPEEWLSRLNEAVLRGNKREIKCLLPESFMQKRMWCINYKTLRNIITQRENHELVEWQIFLKNVLSQVNHPELLPCDMNKLDSKIADKLSRGIEC